MHACGLLVFLQIHKLSPQHRATHRTYLYDDACVFQVEGHSDADADGEGQNADGEGAPADDGEDHDPDGDDDGDDDDDDRYTMKEYDNILCRAREFRPWH